MLEVCKKLNTSKRNRKCIDDIKEVLEECPICLSIPRSKSKTIYQCGNGHVICDKCYSQLKQNKCPTCKGKMFKTRSLVSEKVLDR